MACILVFGVCVRSSGWFGFLDWRGVGSRGLPMNHLIKPFDRPAIHPTHNSTDPTIHVPQTTTTGGGPAGGAAGPAEGGAGGGGGDGGDQRGGGHRGLPRGAGDAGAGGGRGGAAHQGGGHLPVRKLFLCVCGFGWSVGGLDTKQHCARFVVVFVVTAGWRGCTPTRTSSTR